VTSFILEDTSLLDRDSVSLGKQFLVFWQHYEPSECGTPLAQWHSTASQKRGNVSNTDERTSDLTKLRLPRFTSRTSRMELSSHAIRSHKNMARNIFQ